MLYKLKDGGFSAYLVGGCVRDLLLGNHPKDFDVATNAKPEQVKKLFNNCLLIGKRFRLAHIRFGREIIEVATFRAAEHKKSNHRVTADHGMLLRDNIYGSIDEDIWRRDFTVNALYYNIEDFSIVDYCNGINDLNERTLRLIGEPEKRYQEDPVRLLRVVRFAAKLNFQIAPETEAPITNLASILHHVSPARLFDETLKIFHSGYATQTVALLQKYNLFEQLFAQANASLENIAAKHLIELICQSTDQRIAQDKSVTPAFLFSGFLWHAMQEKFKENKSLGQPIPVARDRAVHEILSKQLKQTSIPKRFTGAVKEIWLLEFQLERRHKKYITHTLSHPRFRAAYDLLLLRTQAEPTDKNLSQIAHWWTVLQEANAEQRIEMINELPSPQPRRHHRNKNHRPPTS